MSSDIFILGQRASLSNHDICHRRRERLFRSLSFTLDSHADAGIITDTMDEYLDETCLFALCCILLLSAPINPFTITGFLGAVILVCTASAPRPVCAAIQLCFLACSCLFDAAFAFLPIAVYCLMHERQWLRRLLWILPLAIQGACLGLSLPWIQMLIASGIACGLAVRDVRAVAEHQGITRAYDGLREHVFAAKAEEPTGAEVGTVQEPELFTGLTKREIAVARLVAEGMDNREISQRLFLSEGTVRNHISAILAKKDLTNRTQIAILYYRGP